MDHRQIIFDKLSNGLTYNVFMERVDVLRSNMFPFINVQYDEITEDLIGHDFTFRATTKVIITVADNGTADNTATIVYSIIEEIKQLLLSDSKWRSENFEYLIKMNTRFGQMSRHEAAGEYNYIVGNITLVFEETTTYLPVIPNTLDKLHTEIQINANTEYTTEIITDQP